MTAVSQATTGRGLFALFASGLAGILTLPFVVAALVRAQVIPVPAELEGVVVGASLINPLILLGIGLALGASNARKVGLRSMIAAGRMDPGFARVAAQCVAAGLVLAVVIIGLDHLFADATQALDQVPPEIRSGSWRDLVSGLLYGGITEEVMMRWGAMSFIAWLASKATGSTVPAAVMWTAIVLSALLFGVGHLPAASTITPLTTALVIRTVLLNAIAGVAFGYLFWKRNLEAAMIAHGAAHIAFTVAALV